eukprot:Awhi_evm1s13372
MKFQLFLGLALASTVCGAPISTSQNLNIHIKLSSKCNKEAVKFNKKATKIIGDNNTVDFVNNIAEPHITLYLTDFNKDALCNLQEYVNNFVWAEDCVVNLDHGRNSGTGYVFWDPDVRTPDCLAKLAQVIMDDTNQYILTPTEELMPSWINGLDEPEKSDKIENYMKYGSPNIGKYYEPHVTYAAVAYGVEGDFDAVAEVVGTSPGDAPCSYNVAEIALGHTVSNQCKKQAVNYNAGATEILQGNQTIDFVSRKHEPHLTLYLADFATENIHELCEVNLDHARNTGTGYVFWDPDVPTPDCLATLAQTIMDGTKQYIVEPTEENMPSWINGLDEPEKSEKIANFMEYGSPNIGKYYEPHVTYAAVAFGIQGDFEAVAEVAGTENGAAGCSYIVKEIALGQTGQSGTVLTGQDLAESKL